MLRCFASLGPVIYVKAISIQQVNFCTTMSRVICLRTFFKFEIFVTIIGALFTCVLTEQFIVSTQAFSIIDVHNSANLAHEPVKAKLDRKRTDLIRQKGCCIGIQSDNNQLHTCEGFTIILQ